MAGTVLFDYRPTAAAGATTAEYTSPGGGSATWIRRDTVWDHPDPLATNRPSAASDVYQVVASPARWSSKAWKVVLKDGWKVLNNSGERTLLANIVGATNPDGSTPAVDTGETYYTSLSAAAVFPMTAGTISVLDTTGFDAAGEITVYDKVVTYTGKTGTTFTGCDCAQSGTIAIGKHVFQVNTRWYGLSIQVPTTYVGNSHNNIYQFKAIVGGNVQATPSVAIRLLKAAGGTRTLQIAVFGGRFTYSGQQDSKRTFTIIQPTFVPTDQWIDLMWVVKWSWKTTGAGLTPDGYVKLWWKYDTDTTWGRNSVGAFEGGDFAVVDSSGAPHATIYNTLRDGTSMPITALADDKSFSIGIYRGDTTGTDTLYYGGGFVGTDRSAVEANFGIDSDVTAPVISAAAVVGDTLTLTYGESLDTNSVPATGAYTVTVNGAGRGVDSVAISSNTVTLVLASAVTAGQTVLVSYTAGAAPVQDPSGNDAANLTNRAVTNNTGADPATLPALPDGDVRYGLTTNASSWGSLSADKKRVTKVSVAQDLALTKIHTRFKADVGGTQVYKLVVYDDDGAGGVPGSVLYASGENSGTGTFADQWISHAASGTILAGEVRVGTISGATNAVLKIAYDTVADAGWFNADTYSDGAADPFGAGTALAQQHNIVLEGTPAGGTAAPAGDVTAPVFYAAGAYADGVTLILPYDEGLDEASVPAASAFTVTAGGVPRSISAVDVSGDTVTLTVSEAFSRVHAVAVSYAVPGSGKIRDSAGNNAVAFADQVISNFTDPPSNGMIAYRRLRSRRRQHRRSVFR